MIKLLWEWRKVDIMLTASSLTKMTTIAKKTQKLQKRRQKFCKNDNAAQGG